MSAHLPLPAPGRFKLSDGQTAAFALVDACHAAIAADQVERHVKLLDGQDDALAAEIRHEAQTTAIDLWKALGACNIAPVDLLRVLGRGAAL